MMKVLEVFKSIAEKATFSEYIVRNNKFTLSYLKCLALYHFLYITQFN